VDVSKIKKAKVMRLIVTGAGGYIGSVITYALLRNDHQVIAIDNFSRGFREPLLKLASKFPDQLEVIEHDLLSDNSTLFPKISQRIDAVIHLAAHCIVDESVTNPQKYLSENPMMLANVLDLMKKLNVDSLLFSSTAAVYGEPDHLPVKETAPLKPINPYGESKVICEKLITDNETLNKYVIFRFFNVCGASADGLIGDSKKPSELLVQNIVRGAMGIEPFKITCSDVDTPDRTPIRDFIDVEDLAQAHLNALIYLNQGGKSEVFNLGTEKGYSVMEVVRAAEMIFQSQINITKAEPRKGEQKLMVADSSKAQSTLGWKPQRGIDDSIRALKKWYSYNPHGWGED
jgi:UDP-glucose 4-epimerase